MADAPDERSRCSPQGSPRELADELRVVPDGEPDAVQRRRWLRCGLGRERAEVLRLLGDVEEDHRDLDATDAVGERVVQLADKCCGTVGQPVHQGDLPERSGMVELGHLGTPGHLEHGVERSRSRSRDPAHVVAQVEVGVDLPPRRHRRSGLDDALPEHRHQPPEAVEPVDDHVPVGRPVQHDDRDDRRPQGRIVLHRPGERVAVAHGLNHRWPPPSCDVSTVGTTEVRHTGRRSSASTLVDSPVRVHTGRSGPTRPLRRRATHFSGTR